MVVHLRSVPALSAQEDGLPAAAATFEEFFETAHRRLFTALCLVTGNRHEAEEIMQDAFLRVFERWDRVAAMDDPEGYLFRAAMNVFRNRYRRTALVMRRALSVAPPPTDDLAPVEARDEVVRLLRELAPRERAAILLTAILDLSAEEAGRMLGVKASTVRGLAARARAHMKNEARDPR